jgi:hypothetical protein
VSAQYCHPRLISDHYHPAKLRTASPVGSPVNGPVNLYVIGSNKVNPPTGFMLQSIQSRYHVEGTRWYIGRIPEDPETGRCLPDAPREDEESGDYECAVYEIVAGECHTWRGELSEDSRDQPAVRRTDYGIVLRNPHPDYPPKSGRLVVILAGAHSLGTGAACLAATRSVTIRAIREKLPRTHEFEDKSRAFWALIKGTIAGDRMLDDTGVDVVKAGWYEPRTDGEALAQ